MSNSRQFFGTDGIRGKANVHPLTPDFVVRLGQAVAEIFLAQRGDDGEQPHVVIGKDTRQSGDMLESAIAEGFNSRGVHVSLAGVIPTPAVAMLTRDERAILGVVISASHNPFEDNGIKFFGPDGFKLGDEVELAIEQRVLSPEPFEEVTTMGRTSVLEDAEDRYVAFVRDGSGRDPALLEGLTIALDNANGASYRTSEAILRSLGANVLPFHREPNGININDDCGCTHPDVIGDLVRESGADVGVSHDGDADRVLLCDETGSVLDGDEIMAIAAVAMMEDGSLKDNTLVATIMSNAGLDEAVAAAGGNVVRAGVGDRYVLEEMRKNGFNLGGEQSGHFIFLDQNTTGDGIVSAVQLLKQMRKAGKPLSELRKVLTKFPQAQRNVRVERKPALTETSTHERVTEIESTLGSSGRILLRYSGTEPLLRILIEGREEQQINVWADELAESFARELGNS
ncbi:MAG: phosphoglucosamine mutase [Verrucomicrobiota bacterium]